MLETISYSDATFWWRIAGSVALMLAVLGVIIWIGRLRARAPQQVTAGKLGQPDKRTKTKKPLGMAHFLLSLAALLAACWIMLQIWGVDTSAMFSAHGGFALRGVVRVVIIVAIAAAALEVTNLAARVLLEKVTRKDSDHRRRAAKLRTVAPLLSGLISAIIMLAALAMVLSEAGIEVAPLLAGAGVAGIAIGFGAQSLVKDLFTGAFLIIEDIVSHGDVVEISGVTGTVEAMTLRTIRLRSFDGTLHIFPYGEAQVIHNKTSSFSCFAFELQISYLSSIDAAIRTVVQVGEEIAADTALAPFLIGKLQLDGVDKLSDNGVILKGRMRTTAGDNGKVGNVFLKRVKERLDEAGVLISHRHLPAPPFDTIREFVATPRAGEPAGTTPN